MTATEEFLALYRTFIMEMNLLSKIDGQQFTQSSYDNDERYEKLRLAIDIKTQQQSAEGVGEDVLSIVNKIDVKRYKANGYALTSKDVIVQSMLTQFSERISEMKVYDAYATTFKITSLTNLLESKLTKLMVWWVKNFNPKASCLQNQLIKMQDLELFTKVDEARAFVIERYVHDLTYKSARDWISDLANMLIPSVKGSSEWRVLLDDMVEMYLKRNLLVHHSGIVNAVYLDSSPLYKDNRSTLKIGDSLKLDTQCVDVMFASSLGLMNLFFKQCIECLLMVEEDKEKTHTFLSKVNDVGMIMYEQNQYVEGAKFYKALAKLAVRFVDEDNIVTYFFYYNYYLGCHFQDKIDQKKTQVKKFFEYSKQMVWWWEQGGFYTQFAEKSLLLSKKDFSDEVIDYVNTLNIKDEQVRREVIWISKWPMMQLLQDDSRWENLMERIYCEL